MDILLPSAASRIPELQRNAGGRLFKTAGELNAYLRDLNSRGGVGGVPMPLVSADARFNDRFDSVDLRIARPFALRGSVRIEPMVEIFNVFNVTNFLGSPTRRTTRASPTRSCATATTRRRRAT